MVGAIPSPAGNFSKFLNVMVTGALSRRSHWSSRYASQTVLFSPLLIVLSEKKPFDFLKALPSSNDGILPHLKFTLNVLFKTIQTVV